MSKPFDRELYDRDDAAKEFVITYFTERYGFLVYVNPDQYGIVLYDEIDAVLIWVYVNPRAWHV